MKYILSIDQGTSSSRAILFDQNFNIVATCQQEFPQYYPKAGWVEQNPEEIWESQIQVINRLFEKHKISTTEIASIGITNQRETAIIWDKNTGKPIYNAIVWQDKRTSEFCSSLQKTEWNEYIKSNTGLMIDSYFSATKINWILENVVGARQKAENGDLLFGTIDTWLVWKLTNGKSHLTDFSNASRTMIFNIKTLQWDKKLLELFKIPEKMLPKVVSSSQKVAETEIFDTKILISGIIGDQQAALFGQTCFDVGTAKNTYGTGCFMLMNTGENMIDSQNLLTTIAWELNGKITYALEGSVFIAGAAIQWLRDGLKLIESAQETEKIAQNTEHIEDLYVIPAFSGLGAPYWNMYVKGAILGLTQGVTNNHIVKATIESLAYQTKDVLSAMEKNAEIKLEKLYVDGGASANNFLMQFQADILHTEVVRPQSVETTALGAAYLAALAVNFCTKKDILEHKMNDKTFIPCRNNEKFDNLYKGWQNAIKILIGC